MKKLYVVRLSEEERSELTKLVKTGRAPAYRRRHAEILLQADQGQHGPALHDRQIVDKLDVARQTVEKVRKNAVSRKGWKRRWGAASAAVIAPRYSMAKARRNWSPSPVANRRADAHVGRCTCWPMS